MVADKFFAAGLVVVELKVGDLADQRLQKRLPLDHVSTWNCDKGRLPDVLGPSNPEFFVTSFALLSMR